MIGCSIITNLKQFTKYFPIIGSFITLIAIFTPTSFSTIMATTYFVWMFQIFLHVYPPPVNVGLLRNDPALLTFSIIFTVIIFSSAIIIIWSSFLYKRKKLLYQKLKKLSALTAILITSSTLAWIIMMEFYYVYYGSNHWIGFGQGHYIPHFGVIGPFIGSGFILLGVLFERNANLPEKLEKI